MPFTPITVVQGTTPVNATWGNNAQTQYTESILSFGPDLFAPFVVSGLVATADGTTLNQLDVTAGDAYLLQSDSTLRQRKTAASVANQFLTSVINTTYYLFLNNDGTFTFSTTSTPPTNSLAICQATTNASGNISGVTDKRFTTAQLLPTAIGALQLGASSVGGTNTLTPAKGHLALGTTLEVRGTVSVPLSSISTTVVAGTALGVGAYSYACTFTTDDGETTRGPNTGSATTTTNNQAVNLSAIPTSTDPKVTGRNIYRTKVGGSTYYLLTTLNDNTTTTFADTTPDASLVNLYAPTPTAGGASIWYGSSGNKTAYVSGATGQAWFDAGAITSDGLGDWTVASLVGSGGLLLQSRQSGAATGIEFDTWSGSAKVVTFSLGSQINGAPAWVDTAGNLFANELFVWTGGAQKFQVDTGGRLLMVAGVTSDVATYGVPIHFKRALEVSVTSTTQVNVVLATTPNDTNHFVRFSGSFTVGAGNTNNGTCTFKVAYTPPGGSQITFFLNNYSGGIAVNASTVTKGATLTAASLTLECAPNTTIAIQYQNTATGTIADTASGDIEVL